MKSAKRLGSLFSIAPINEVYDVHALASYDNWARINQLDHGNETIIYIYWEEFKPCEL